MPKLSWGNPCTPTGARDIPNRWRDWLAQAEHDFGQASASHRDGRHDWSCFAAHQARVLDNYHVPARYPNGHVEGPAYEHYGSLHSSQAPTMPAQSSTSSVKHWPTADFVLTALREWAGGQAEARPELAALGYFGSHARGDSGFGSDLDLVAIVERSEVPRMERNRDRPYEKLPVPADLLVFTVDEWRGMMKRGGRFAGVMEREVVWVVGSRP